jgi:hypothetical protein
VAARFHEQLHYARRRPDRISIGCVAAPGAGDAFPRDRNLGHAVLGARPAGQWAVPGAQARTHPAHRPPKERHRPARRYAAQSGQPLPDPGSDQRRRRPHGPPNTPARLGAFGRSVGRGIPASEGRRWRPPIGDISATANPDRLVSQLPFLIGGLGRLTAVRATVVTRSSRRTAWVITGGRSFPAPWARYLGQTSTGTK